MKRYRAWAVCMVMAAGWASLLMGAKGDAAKGKEVFAACAVCHNPDNGEKKIGPGLKGLFKRDKLAGGKKPTEANIRTLVDEGGNGMPAYKELLDDHQKDDLIAYLKTL